MTDLQALSVVAIASLIGYAAGRSLVALVLAVWAGPRRFGRHLHG